MCRAPNTGNEIAGLSESVDSESPNEKGFRVDINSEHSPVTVLKVSSRST